jgi:hypothetical protein
MGFFTLNYMRDAWQRVRCQFKGREGCSAAQYTLL